MLASSRANLRFHSSDVSALESFARGFTPLVLNPVVARSGVEVIYRITGPHEGDYQLVELRRGAPTAMLSFCADEPIRRNSVAWTRADRTGRWRACGPVFSPTRRASPVDDLLAGGVQARR
jgi:hypothetical protein